MAGARLVPSVTVPPRPGIESFLSPRGGEGRPATGRVSARSGEAAGEAVVRLQAAEGTLAVAAADAATGRLTARSRPSGSPLARSRGGGTGAGAGGEPVEEQATTEAEAAAQADRARLLLLRSTKAQADAQAHARMGGSGGGGAAGAVTAADVSREEAAQRVAAVVQAAAREPLRAQDSESAPLWLDLDGRGPAALALPMEEDGSGGTMGGRAGAGGRMSARGLAAHWHPVLTAVFPRPPPDVLQPLDGTEGGADGADVRPTSSAPSRRRRAALRKRGGAGGSKRSPEEAMPPTALAVAARVSREREERARQGNRRAAGGAVRLENQPLSAEGTPFFRAGWHSSEVAYSLDWPWYDEDRRDPVDRALAAAATGASGSAGGRAGRGSRGGGAAGGGGGGGGEGGGAGAGWRLDEAVEAQELERGRLLAVRQRSGSNTDRDAASGAAGAIGEAVHPLAARSAGLGESADTAAAGSGGGAVVGAGGSTAMGVAELDVARLSFQGPPEMISALASHANDLPLPPFDGRMQRGPRTSDVTGLHGADSGAAVKLPEMRFRDFPELFQPVRVTASPVNSPALQLRAGGFLLRLLGALAQSYVSARQLADIVRVLPLSVPGLRVEVAVSLFPRVLDLSEFDRVLFALSGPERRRVVRRLGWLNLWNPTRPDGDYILDLRVWEERMLATLLAQMAVVEPGETVVGVGGRGGPDFNRIAGWRLPTTWIDETPDHGVLRLHFSSYERGCRPDAALRKALCRHVLTFC